MYKGVNTDKPNTYFFFLQYLGCARRREMGPDLGNKSKGSQIYKIVPTFNHLGILYCFLNMILVLAFELRPSLNCTKERQKGLGMTT